MKYLCALGFLLLTFFSCSSFAASLSGKVTNGTTNKPAAGDEVILIKLTQTMEEVAHSKTDSQGNFTIKLEDTTSPHLVRVIHQGVTYHRMAPPGTPSVEVTVYDVAKELAGISVTADVFRFQAKPDELDGIRLLAVNNASNPPRTQMQDQNFEFYLPDGAQIDQAMAMTAGGQPINSDPIPTREKNRYAFAFPLRPGETQFQVVYHLPYSGKFSVNPKTVYGIQHFVVILPKTMTFNPASGAAFQAMNDPRQSDANVQVISNVEVGQALGFSISGTGTLEEAKDDAGPPTPVDNGQAATAAPRPGGGLGPPIDAPDPLEKYRWYILGGFAIVLLVGSIVIAARSNKNSSVAMVEEDTLIPTPLAAPAATVPAPTPRPNSNNKSTALLDALKDELFELEIERNQGRISQAEYDKAKAALDQTLERALKRSALAQQ